ncbi:hypothetical protein [Phenylobacterium sp.]|jgi:hypothetical protein|uniref:hypothetical protein n=1 Tax=Phenylobacterium sp. TaxID=1871053 RepID=UPI002F92A559
MAKVVLGDEFDRSLRECTRRALKEAGGKRVATKWGVAGSQELDAEEWSFGAAKIVLEAETYTGLSLSGPEDLLRQIATALGQNRSP